MMKKLPTRMLRNETSLVASLVELFDQIDVNGDGVMEVRGCYVCD